MSDKNKPMNDYIRQKAGYKVADPPASGDLKPAQGSADAGKGTTSPPPAKRDMNDMNEAIRKAAGRAKWN